MNNTANVKNLELVRTATERLCSRTAGLPGMACLYAPAGYGKTTAAMAVGNENRAYFVQIRSAWTRKALLEKILVEMSIKASGTLSDMLDQVASQLAASGRMLMLDEFDYAVRSDAMVELIRDIYEASQSTILLLGEELLPQKLRRYERFHSRVLTWIPAEPVTVQDATLLAPIYAPRVRVAEDLLDRLVRSASGSIRRVCVNLANVADEADLEGWESIDLAGWGDRPIYTGEAPRRGA